MRRHALGLIASGGVLFAASALGVMGSWATLIAVLLLTTGALLLAIVMEDATAPGDLPTPIRAQGSGPDLAA